jgi:hypothetical protein
VRIVDTSAEITRPAASPPSAAGAPVDDAVIAAFEDATVSDLCDPTSGLDGAPPLPLGTRW